MDVRYILMNKNRPIAGLACYGGIVSIATLLGSLPDFLRLDIDNWVSHRFDLVGRQNIQKLASLANIHDTEGYLTISRAISVTDTFWVNDTLNPTTWEKINPYRNKLSKIMSDIAIDGIQVGKQYDFKSPSPQYTLEGSTDKCVKRYSNGKLYLYKTSGEKWSDLAGCRPYSEYLATQVSKILGIKDVVSYNIIENKTSNGYIKPYCYCELFTNEALGFVPMAYTKFSRTPTSDLYDILDNKSKTILKEMILLDSIILNTDRHQGNYGILYDNNTFEIRGLSPIYDNDVSLGSLTSIQYKTFDDAYNEALRRDQNWLGLGGLIEQVNYIMTPQIYKQLKQIGKVQLTLPNSIKGLPKQRLEFANYIVNRRIKEIIDDVERRNT